MRKQTYVTTRHTTVQASDALAAQTPDIRMQFEIVTEQNKMALVDGWLPLDLARCLVRHFAR